MAVSRVGAAWLHTVAPWFQPVAEVPEFTGQIPAPEQMTDAEWVESLARHPLDLSALAAAAGVPVEAVEQRLRGLVAAGRVVIEEHDGQRVARVATS